MFRWDARQRFAASGGKVWLTVALAGWVGVGLLAQWQDRVIPIELAAERAAIAAAASRQITPASSQTPPTETAAVETEPADIRPVPAPPATEASADEAASPLDAAPPPRLTTAADASREPLETMAQNATAAVLAPPPPPAAPEPDPADAWKEVTIEQVMADLVFDRLAPDAGVVTPVADLAQEPPEEAWTDLDVMYTGLQTWAPGRVPDVLTRTRNLLFVPAVVDVFQLPMEAYVPLMVYEILERDIDRDVLIKALYWIAVHPDEGSDAAVDQMAPLGLPNGPSDMHEVRGRLGVYAVKLIGRITGARPAH
jgi:hypothetical protein